MTDFASLGIQVDASQVKDGERALDNLAKSGANAEQATKRLTTASEEAARANANWRTNMAGAAVGLKETASASIELSNATQRVLDRYDPLGTKLRSLQSEMATLRKEMGGSTSEGALKAFAGLETDIAKTKEMMVAAGVAMEGTGKNAAGLGLNSQYARRELMELGKEALTGNFSRMPQTFGSLVAHSNLLAAAMSPIGLVVLGAAASAGVLAAAFYQGSKEAEAMTRALDMTGNISGQTVSSMHGLAAATANMSNLTVGSTKEMELAFVKTGQIGAGALAQVMEASAKYADQTGMDAAKASEHLIKIFKDPTKGAEELNSSMHFLTVAQLAHIEALQSSFDVTGAQEEAARLLREELDKHPPVLGFIEEKLISGKKLWSEYWGAAIRKISGNETFEDKLAQANRRVNTATNPHDRQMSEVERFWLIKANEKEMNQATESSVEKEMNKQDHLAMAYAKTHSEISKGIELRNRLSGLQDAAERQPSGSQERSILDDAIRKTQEEISKIGKTKTDRTADQITRAQLGLDVDAIRKSGVESADAFSNADKVLKALRDSSLVSEADYYTSKHGLLEASGRSQESALQQEIDRLGREHLVGAAALENDKKIADAKSKLAKVKADTAVQQEILNLQESRSLDKLGRSYVDARIAEEQYLATVSLRYSREVNGIGKGTEYRANQSGLNAIDDRFLEKQQKLAKDLRDNLIDPDAYARYLIIAKDTYSREVAAYNDRTAAILEKKKSWSDGMSEALQNYLSGVQNVAAHSERLFTNAFKNMEDAMVSFVRTGKLDFRSMADSIINDLIRIQIQQNVTQPLAQAMAPNKDGSGGFMNGLKSIFGFADGGIMTNAGPLPLNAYASGGIANSPQLAMFGEGRTPEAFVPLPDGRRIPVAMQGGSGQSVTVNSNLTISAPGADAGTVARIRELMPTFIAENQRVVVGAVNQALVSRGQAPLRA